MSYVLLGNLLKTLFQILVTNASLFFQNGLIITKILILW